MKSDDFGIAARGGGTASNDAPLADRAYPPWLSERERGLVAARRTEAGVPTQGSAAPIVGLALSGGGIRSATFALGVLQALARNKVLRKIDFLSTVSGGGYAGSFWGALHLPQKDRAGGGDAPNARIASDVETLLGAETDREAFPVSWLRQNGRYLAPARGASFLMFSILVRNWISVLFNLMIPVVIIVLTSDLVRAIAASRGWFVQGHSPVVVGYLWWSPGWVVPAALLALSLPFGGAYWLVPPRQPGMPFSTWWTAVVIGGCGLALGLPNSPVASHFGETVRAVLVGAGVVSLTSVVLSAAVSAGGGSAAGLPLDGFFKGQLTEEAIARSRHRLTAGLKNLAILAVATGAMAAIDTVAQTIYALAVRAAVVAIWSTAILAPAVFIVTWGPRVLAAVGKPDGPLKVSLSLDAILAVAGIVVAGIFAVTAATFAHALAFRGGVPAGDPGGLILAARWPNAVAIVEDTTRAAPGWIFGAVCLLGLVTAMLNRARSFLNQSSISSFYAARLTRTYLGASNVARETAWNGGSSLAGELDATEPVPGDDILLAKYRPHEHGGPLHILNVTLNETLDGRTATEQFDRKGRAFAVGPASVSVGIEQHVLRGDTPVNASNVMRLERRPLPGEKPGAFIVFDAPKIDAEELTLGRWVAISGAAVSTALGNRTSVGASLLTGLFNLRLGYWWFSGTNPYASKPGRALPIRLLARVERFVAWLLPVLSHFYDELSARFHGTARRHWLLTDGGHFENTACYELVRRRVPIIVCVDASEDPKYQFNDLANLARKVRIDFGAKIEFVDDPEVRANVHPSLTGHFGSLDALRRFDAKDGKIGQPGGPCAALARIRYAPRNAGEREEFGLLVVLKPTLSGQEFLDVRNYAVTDPAFPHQSTGDQFFDEAQWESYRALGDYVAGLVFRTPVDADAGWYPASMTLPQAWSEESPEHWAAPAQARRTREAIALVLSARQVPLSDSARATLEAASDVARLEQWLRHASTAASERDVFREN